jgi:hypothetical protein
MDRIIKAEDDPKFREAKRFGLQKERERRKTYIRFGLQGNLREHLVCFRLGLHSSAWANGGGGNQKTRALKKLNEKSFNFTLSSTLTTLQRILLGTWNILICSASSAESLGSCSCQKMKKRKKKENITKSWVVTENWQN